LKPECLSETADNLPDRLDAVARAATQAEPAVTELLGKEGTRGLRDELRRAAIELGAEPRGAASAIGWPEGPQSSARSRSAHSALVSYLNGPRMDKTALILKEHGHGARDDDARHAQGIVSPRQLYDETALGPLAKALGDLAQADSQVAVAVRADDAAAVDDIWGQGPPAARPPDDASRWW
jgi:hypothetical protein